MKPYQSRYYNRVKNIFQKETVQGQAVLQALPRNLYIKGIFATNKLQKKFANIRIFFQVSFDLHQKRHLEDARKRGMLEGEDEDEDEQDQDDSDEDDTKEFGSRRKRRKMNTVDAETRLIKIKASPNKRGRRTRTWMSQYCIKLCVLAPPPPDLRKFALPLFWETSMFTADKDFRIFQKKIENS